MVSPGWGSRNLIRLIRLTPSTPPTHPSSSPRTFLQPSPISNWSSLPLFSLLPNPLLMFMSPSSFSLSLLCPSTLFHPSPLPPGPSDANFSPSVFLPSPSPWSLFFPCPFSSSYNPFPAFSSFSLYSSSFPPSCSSPTPPTTFHMSANS